MATVEDLDRIARGFEGVTVGAYWDDPTAYLLPGKGGRGFVMKRSPRRQEGVIDRHRRAVCRSDRRRRRHRRGPRRGLRHLPHRTRIHHPHFARQHRRPRPPARVVDWRPRSAGYRLAQQAALIAGTERHGLTCWVRLLRRARRQWCRRVDSLPSRRPQSDLSTGARVTSRRGQSVLSTGPERPSDGGSARPARRAASRRAFSTNSIAAGWIHIGVAAASCAVRSRVTASISGWISEDAKGAITWAPSTTPLPRSATTVQTDVVSSSAQPYAVVRTGRPGGSHGIPPWKPPPPRASGPPTLICGSSKMAAGIPLVRKGIRSSE